MSVVSSALTSVTPSEDGSLHTAIGSHDTGREGTIADDESYYSQDTLDESIVDVTSDSEGTETVVDDDDVDYTVTSVNRKPSPAPATTSHTSSVQLPGNIKADDDDDKPTSEDEKPTPRRRRQTGPNMPPLTEAEKAQIVLLFETGWTGQQIAERLGRNKNTIHSFMYRRKLQKEAMLATLPGAPVPSPPKKRRIAKTEQQQQDGASVLADQVRAATAGIPDHAPQRRRMPQFRFRDEDDDVKPRMAKKEERI